MEPEMPLVVVNNFRINGKIGSGTTGVTYLGIDSETNEEIAIKMEKVDTKRPQLRYESHLYKRLLRNGDGFPDVKFYVVKGGYNILGMSLLGPSLESLFSCCRKRFSLKTVLMIAIHMISRVQFVHRNNYVHGDIKPRHFCMGLGRYARQVYAIDFGRARKYRDSSTRSHIPYREKESLSGTPEYISLNSHLRIEQTRRDDLESVGYVLVYFLRGSLPWQGLVAKNRKEKFEMIRKMKVWTRIEDLCEGCPSEFATYLHYCRSLKFDEKPDYSKMKRMFHELFKREGFKYDYVYDWNETARRR